MYTNANIIPNISETKYPPKRNIITLTNKVNKNDKNSFFKNTAKASLRINKTFSPLCCPGNTLSCTQRAINSKIIK